MKEIKRKYIDWKKTGKRLLSLRNNNTTQRQNSSYSQPSYTQQNFQQVDIPDAELPF